MINDLKNIVRCNVSKCNINRSICVSFTFTVIAYLCFQLNDSCSSWIYWKLVKQRSIFVFMYKKDIVTLYAMIYADNMDYLFILRD